MHFTLSITLYASSLKGSRWKYNASGEDLSLMDSCSYRVVKCQTLVSSVFMLSAWAPKGELVD